MSKNRRHHLPHENQSESVVVGPGEREQSEHEQTQSLAYRYWEQRGCPIGDPETDWRKAEQELARQREAATRL